MTTRKATLGAKSANRHAGKPPAWAEGYAAALRSARSADCPVATLAVETAALRRLWGALSPTAPDPSLAGTLDEHPEGVSADEVRRNAQRRLATLRELALHRRATSLEGSLFQIYLLADGLNDLAEKFDLHDEHGLGDWIETQRQLIFNALPFLERDALDRDLAQLRGELLPPELDTARVTEELLEPKPTPVTAGRVARAR